MTSREQAFRGALSALIFAAGVEARARAVYALRGDRGNERALAAAERRTARQRAAFERRFSPGGRTDAGSE